MTKNSVINGKRCANTAWCGRRDGSMIFIPNVCEVAPPHTRGVSRLDRNGEIQQ
jgi:hypothetical protein